MGVTIVVGGQWGSEGKGKVAHWYAKSNDIPFVVRVGGSNSGHTVIDGEGKRLIFKALPTASIEKNVTCVLPAGTYIDLDILREEMAVSGLQDSRLKIHPNAVIITEELKRREAEGSLCENIGSTGSGTGAAVAERISRREDLCTAKDVPSLKEYICDTTALLREAICNGLEILVEGTQGYGLSLLHADTYPYVTSRDTTAAGFLTETGLSPFDVTNIIMVIRSYPIRVSGKSGPLPKEITWEDITKQSGSEQDLIEYTSVTQKVRRVAEFDCDIVKKAMAVNRPNMIVLNHCDYLDAACYDSDGISELLEQRVSEIESQIGRIGYLGLSERSVIKR